MVNLVDNARQHPGAVDQVVVEAGPDVVRLSVCDRVWLEDRDGGGLCVVVEPPRVP